jgi:cyclophilin family peptidyl-prolyl cis-trans isomerase
MFKIRHISVIVVLLSAVVSVFGQSRQVQVSTNLGDIKLVLYDDTPLHRDAFIELAQQGHFDGTLFYRVIKDFMIQGGSKDSRNAPPGKRIGYGDPARTVNDEILSHRICKKGALCAPRQPNEINIFKQSDVSQFFLIQGRVFRTGQLDTMELAVNRPIRRKITESIYTPEKRTLLNQLKEEERWNEARQLADEIKNEIEVLYNLSGETLVYTPAQREAYTSIGGSPELENEYTVFGEVITGLEVIDKIAALKTDANDRPLNDVKITVKVIK